MASEFKPTALQQAAINRIHEFQEELKQNGFAMRSGMELEFMFTDSRGILSPASINLNRLNEHLDSVTGLPHLITVKNECTAAYEAIIGDKIEGNPVYAQVGNFSPVGVAANVASLKQDGLKKLLLESSCYSPPFFGKPPHTPNFHAYPYSLQEPGDALSSFSDKSSGLHINVSLYDLKGKNAFSGNKDLTTQCAQKLVELQNEATIAFLPRNNSLARLGKQAHVSVPGGLGMELIDDYATRRTASSVNIRGGIHEVGGKEAKTLYRHDTRIENRLPGADADPFVALAVTMAALVETVRERAQGYTTPEKTNPKFALPTSRRSMARQLESSGHMCELLGEDLHSKILARYTPSAER